MNKLLAFAEPLAILTVAGAAQAYAIYGLIAVKWNQLGDIGGPLGDVTSDERDDGVGGRIDSFRNGWINYEWGQPQAYAIYGLIGAKWNQFGGPRFGNPRTDELTAPDGIGRVSHLNTGVSIYWSPRVSTPQACYQLGVCGAYTVYGSIRVEFDRLRGVNGELGYPVRDEDWYKDFGSVTGERITHFERGFVRWRPDGSILTKLHAGGCLNETGSFVDDERHGRNGCPYFTSP